MYLPERRSSAEEALSHPFITRSYDKNKVDDDMFQMYVRTGEDWLHSLYFSHSPSHSLSLSLTFSLSPTLSLSLSHSLSLSPTLFLFLSLTLSLSLSLSLFLSLSLLYSYLSFPFLSLSISPFSIPLRHTYTH